MSKKNVISRSVCKDRAVKKIEVSDDEMVILMRDYPDVEFERLLLI